MSTSLHFTLFHCAEPITLDVDVTESVNGVKVKIQEKSGIPVQHQSLRVGHRQLLDNHNLNEYNTDRMSTVHAVLRVLGSIDILIRNVNGNTFGIKVDAADTIETVKDKIFDKEGIPVNEQQLVFSGQDNVDDAALRRYIEKESARHVFLRLITMACICVDRAYPPYDPLVLDVTSNWTVADVMRAAADKYMIREDHQRWFLSETETVPSQTIDSFNVSHSSYLLGELKIIGDIYAKVHCMDGIHHSIACSPRDSPQKVRERIRTVTGLPIQQIEILCEGLILTNSLPLMSWCSGWVSTPVELRFTGLVKALIESQSGEGLVFHVDESTNILTLKQYIERSSGLPLAYQKLLHHGVQIEDDKVIPSSTYEDGSVISMLYLKYGDRLKVVVDCELPWKTVLYMERSDTVGQLKERLASEEGPLKQTVQLFTGQEELQNGLSLGSYTPNEEPVIKLSTKLRIIQVSLFACVECRTYDIQVPHLATIGDIKRAGEKQGLRLNRRYVWFDGEPLEDSATLSESCISNGSSLRFASW